jgi:periplasmic protein CpxP/Spy
MMKLVGILLLAGIGVQAQPPGDRPVMDRGYHTGPPRHSGSSGRWWANPATVQRLGLTEDQQKKIEEVFGQSRLKLIDLSASLQKEEAILEPLLDADPPEEPKILAQIDRVAQARAELEKANARMLLGFRTVLTQDQWKKLQLQPRGPGPRPR